MSRPVSDIAFSASVKAEQTRRGSRSQFERMEQSGGWPSAVTGDLAAFLSTVRTAYIGTASADGQPYIQHRGGEPGFLKVIDEHTIGFADLAGNRQYITAGNLAENPRAFLFVMDYKRRIRIKLWGRARIVDNDDELLARLRPSAGNVNAERSLLFAVEAWDRNCSQHIPVLVPIDDIEDAMSAAHARIAELESQLARLHGASRD
jgi:predicted pyridoxine 5'-phosphate oxidase superfamily flavin-nucleotide-binding protein